jgi:hypothetical protein
LDLSLALFASHCKPEREGLKPRCFCNIFTFSSWSRHYSMIRCSGMTMTPAWKAEAFLGQFQVQLDSHHTQLWWADKSKLIINIQVHKSLFICDPVGLLILPVYQRIYPNAICKNFTVKQFSSSKNRENFCCCFEHEQHGTGLD